jgi:arsenical pump membrane protein
LAGAAGAVAAAVASPAGAAASAHVTWPPFVLVAGLLVIGAVAAAEGLFEAAGAAVARLPGGGFSLLVALLLLDAVVTAVLNLDTAVVFLTPVLLHAARRRGLDERPFLYGAVFMANAASLLLPGSNLTNLIVLAREHITGSLFAARMLPAWIASVAVVIAVLAIVYRRELAAHGGADASARPAVRLGPGLAGALGAAALVLALRSPALPVLGLALVVAVWARLRPRAAVAAVSPFLLIGVFGVAIALGTLARSLDILGNLTESTGRWTTATLGAGAAVLVNNLPAAVMLSAHLPAHPRALLVGLDLGPNLAVSGSLSAVLWLQVARAEGARPSAITYTKLGLLVAPLGIAAALAIQASGG